MARALVLASNNRGKIAELTEILAPYGVTVYPLSRFTTESAEETGSTYRDNALLKARFAAKAAGLPAIADDSGIEVDALGGAPGVYSARFSGPSASDAANNEKLLTLLAGEADGKRTARFRCVLAYVADEAADAIFAEGVWEGRILRVPRGVHGFGYDPLFLPIGSDLTAAELSTLEKNRVSHRSRAFRDLATRLFAGS